MEIQRNTILEVQKMLNRFDMVLLGMLYSKAEGNESLKKQIEFAMDSSLDSQRLSFKESNEMMNAFNEKYK